MPHNRLTPELQQIISTSREIAISFHHDYIHTVHLFMAMLQHDCLASPFLKKVDSSKWAAMIKNDYPAVAAATLPESLPLTIDAERLIIHAWTFAYSRKKDLTNSVDLLLAMLAYDNPIKEELGKAGWSLDQVLQQHYGAGVAFPVLPLKEKMKISRFRWTFMSKQDREKAVRRAYGNAAILIDYQMYDEAKDLCNNILSLSKDQPDIRSLLDVIAQRQQQ